ncbi:MAG: phosphatidate cytidylyltransferase [Chloroflexi bacterium]|nr:phosphatidate cytidylyltransferase [Chloroflexota bacterium]
MLHNDLLATLATLALSLIWLRAVDFLAHRGWISSELSRKIIHIGTGPLFVLCWLLFTDAPLARFLAALVPLGITAQFVLVGTGVIRDPAAVKAMSRGGDRSEILKGPLYYGIAFVVLTLVFWRATPVGIAALMLLCGGDGLADLVGNKYPKYTLPWSGRKTWAGTFTVFAGGLLFCLAVLAIYHAAGIISIPLSRMWPGLVVIAVAGAAVESLPIRDIDNITVPLAAVVLGLILLK